MNFSHRYLILLLLFISPGLGLRADTQEYSLPIGDPQRSQQQVPVVIDVLTNTHSGENLTPVDLADQLANHRLLFVGESHTSIEFHRVQLRIIQELHRAGREVLIGLEMYPYTEQQHLDRWISNQYTEEGFLDISRWYENWSHHWNYYRDIFLYARRNEVPMFAVNAPRKVITAVRKEGFESLTEEQAAHIPRQIDTDSAEHRRLFKAFFDADDPIHASLTEEQWDGMFRAQCTWDATMGFNAVRLLEEHGGPESIMVVLIGDGHVAYGLGIERQAATWFDEKMASLIPVPVRDEEGDPVEVVQASFADFVWGLPPETDSVYPTLGLSSIPVEGQEYRRVIHIAEKSVAERSGFQVGDLLLTFNGVNVSEKGAINREMSRLRWGDAAAVTLLREEKEEQLTAHFTRLKDD
jgi:uncharacterized iron-regulated protein